MSDVPESSPTSRQTGPLRSAHGLRFGYKALLVLVCLVAVVPVLVILPYFLDLPGPTPEARRTTFLWAIVMLGVMALPAFFVLRFTVRSFATTIHLYAHGLGLRRKDEERFVRWSEVQKVKVDRTDTEFRYMMIVPMGTSRDMKAKILTKSGPPIKLHSGIDGVESILNALWTHCPLAFDVKA